MPKGMDHGKPPRPSTTGFLKKLMATITGGPFLDEALIDYIVF
jgi:hypothetical protein